MNLKTLTAVALAALVVGTGAAAAAPGQAPDDAGQQGPPSDLPGPVPDFVESIHGTIMDHINGTVSGLGEAVSDLTPGGDGDGASSSPQ